MELITYGLISMVVRIKPDEAFVTCKLDVDVIRFEL